MNQYTYLGHVVGGGQVNTDSSKIEAVWKFPVPKMEGEVCVK